jgi:ornithine cyclodeaminase
MRVLIITEEDQKLAITMEEVMKVVEVALVEYSEGRTVTPVRMALNSSNGTSLFMPSLVESASSLGVKFVSVYPTNKEKTIHGVMILSDVTTGEPLALLEASYLTLLRTGAASGIATKYLSKEKAKVVAVIGTGRQARGLIQAILHVRPNVSEIRLYNRTKEKTYLLEEELRGQYQDVCPTLVISESPEDAIHRADIINTCTTASKPVFSPEGICLGSHINAVGSFKPNMQEIPTSTLIQANKVVVESREAALAESGDFIIPIKQGLYDSNNIYGELGEIISKSKIGRQTEDEITLFKSVGLAAMDVVVAKALYEKVKEKNLGQKINI